MKLKLNFIHIDHHSNYGDTIVHQLRRELMSCMTKMRVRVMFTKNGNEFIMAHLRDLRLKTENAVLNLRIL